MNIFFNWQRIQEITDLYQTQAATALSQGAIFYPHALGFLASVESGQNGLHIAVPPLMVANRELLDSFIRYVARSLPDQGRIEAAGFILLLPRVVAAEVVSVGPPIPERRVDLVGLLHVEHVFSGVHTWVMNDSTKPEWNLVAKGIASNIPSCLPPRAYGHATVGQS